MTVLQVSLEEQLLAAAEQRARVEGTSLSALVRGWLSSYAGEREAGLEGVRAEGRLLVATGTLSGDWEDHRQILSERDARLLGLK